VDVVLERALDRCDCRRCRALANQLDALIPTPSHVAAYVAMGSAMALTAVFAAAAVGWSWPRLVGMALLVGTLWFACLMGAMAWGGSRLTSPDPLAWDSAAVWWGWTAVVVGLWLGAIGVLALAGVPPWVVWPVGAVGIWQVVRSWRARRLGRGECVRDRTG